MPRPFRLQLVVVACLAAAGSPPAMAVDSFYWAWRAGCSGANLGTTTACWSSARATSGSPASAGGAPLAPTAGSAVSVLQDTGTTLPVQFNGGSFAAGSLFLLGRFAPARVDMSGGSLQVNALLVASQADEGQSGGALFVQTGGTVAASSGVLVGKGTGEVARYEISGGSMNTTQLVVGTITQTPFAAAGTLRIDGSGAVATTYTTVASLATLDMRGGRFSADEMTVESSASLLFTGGTIALANGVSDWFGSSYGFGGQVGQGQPLLRVGQGALKPGVLNIAGRLDVGVFGRGDLQVDAGGHVTTSGGATLGQGVSLGFAKVRGDGRATVGGADATWTNTGALDIGSDGQGRLQVLAGGLLTTGSAFLGRGTLPDAAQPRNSATVSGAGSRWVVGQQLVVGGSDEAAGQGSDLTIGNGGRLEAGSLRLWGEGVLDVQAGGTATVGGALATVAGAQIHNAGEMHLLGRTQWAAGTQLSGDGAKFFGGGLALGNDTFVRLDILGLPVATVRTGGIGQVDDSNAITLQAGNVLEIDLGAAGSHDRYATTSWMQLGGTLRLFSLGGYGGAAGDSFSILGAGQLQGHFAAIDTSGFALEAGLAWDFSRLDSQGIVGISAVPEPAAWGLMALGLAVLGARRRRRA